MDLVFIGQPYCGKTTIFNEVVGYKSTLMNAPGAAVSHTHGAAELDGELMGVVDLPGIYSLQVSTETGEPAVEHILNAPSDTVLVNVIDASVLSRSLELTLQLLELKRPMVIALNMMDEARHKGLAIDVAKLSRSLGVPVVAVVGKKGEGVVELFRVACETGRAGAIPAAVTYPSQIERLIRDLENVLGGRSMPNGFSRHFVAIKLIERDPCVRRSLELLLTPSDWAAVEARLSAVESATEQRAEYLMSAVRHSMAFDVFETVAQVGASRRPDLRQRLDDVLMHPVLGYVILLGILAATFTAVFKIGNSVEPLFLASFERVTSMLGNALGRGTLLFAVVDGAIAGIGGGIGIVIPYLLPFFVALTFLEDSGYLPRIAYLIDNLMHRIGLHGMSVIPIIMGYGCSVPGVLATRMLRSRRDKLITATLTTLIPCSARMTIIFGLIGFFISIQAAVFVYVINLVLIGLVGRVLSLILPEAPPGFVMEIPRYHLPGLKVLANKTWFRLKEFVLIAWPILIAGSVVLEVIDHFALTGPINRLLAPYTAGVLGFPAAVGVTLLFGIMRKEMALVLLFAALGTHDVASAMTPAQILGYTFFVCFYVPCLATFAALAKELSTRTAVLVTAFSLAIVTGLGVLIRFAGPVFL